MTATEQQQQQQSLPEIGRSLMDRMFTEWKVSGQGKSISTFVAGLMERKGFLTDEDKEGHLQWALCNRFRRRLKIENPKTPGLPYGAETPDIDDSGRPIWKQPEDMTYDESEWNLIQNLSRVKQDLARARKWYDSMQARWPGQLTLKFPMLIQVFECGDDSAAMLELSRMSF